MYYVVEYDYMARLLTNTANGCSEEQRQTRVEEDGEPFVFEGITLAHSPRLGRRFVRWLSERFD